MRKSFTRLFSIIMLFGMILLSAVAFGANPLLTGSTPSDGFSNYDGRSGKLIVKLTFDQNVIPGAAHAGIIGLYFGVGQVDPIQISGSTSSNTLTGSTVVISNNEVTVTFNRTLTQGETYYITVSPDALMNASGQYFGGIANSVQDVKIGDYTPPVIEVAGTDLVLTPKDNSIGFALADNLVADFSESVAFGTGNIAIYDVNGNIVEIFELSSDIDVTTPATPASGKVGISADKLYINPSNNLMELNKYYVRIGVNAVKDLSGNATQYFTGINDNGTWNFTAADITAPSVTFFPVNGKSDVQNVPSQSMTITFADNRTGKVPTDFEIRKNVAGDKFAIGENVTTLVSFTENAGVPVGAWTAKYTAINTITFAWATGANDKFVDQGAYVFGIKANSFFDEEKNVSATAITSSFTAGDLKDATMVVLAAPAGSGVAPNNVPADLELKKIFLQSTNTDFSGNDVEVHYLIVANNAAIPTPAAVMAGPVLPNLAAPSANVAQGFALLDGSGSALASKTDYDVYFASKDKATAGNISTQANVTASKKDVQTSDVEAPIPTAKVNTLSTAGLALVSGAGSVANVKLDSPVILTFSENIALTTSTSNVTVKYWNASLVPASWVTLTDGTDYTFAFAANTITITGAHADIAGYGAAAWKNIGRYQVIIDNNEIEDVITGTGTPNKITEKIYDFTVEDFTGPIAVFKGTSSDTKSGVATTANIEIDLGETSTRADGLAIDAFNVFFRDNSTGNIVPSAVTVTDGRYITINPTAANLIDNGHIYDIEITSSIKDVAGNTLAFYKGGLVPVAGADQYLSFTTGDETKPALTFNPSNGSTGLANNVNGMQINVTINEVVKKANGNTLGLSDANYLRTIVSVVKVSDNSPIMFDITNVGATSFTVDLSNFLSAYEANASYKVTVTGLYDAANNLITDNSTTFSIREYTLPTIFSYLPVDGKTLVAAADPIKITFSEPVTGVAGKLISLVRDDVAGTVNFDAAANTSISGSVVTLTGVPAFAQLGKYHIEFPAGAFVDAVGNATAISIGDATTWNFSAFDATKPVILALTPVDAATTPVVGVTALAKPSQLVIDFTEASGNVYAGPGKIYIREVGNTGIPDFTIPAQSGAVVITGTQVKVALNSVLFGDGKDYWVEVGADAFRDESNNYFDGLVNDNTLWNFKTQPNPAPFYVISASTPTDDANDVDLNATVTLKFSEPVKISSPVGKYLTFRNSADGTAHHTVYFDSPSVTWSWNAAEDALTVQHPDFLADRSYYINVTANTFVDKDASQSVVNELDLINELNFTTVDLTAPVISNITVNNTDVKGSLATTPSGIAKDGKIVVTFSEPVTIATPNSAVSLNAGAVAYTATFVANVLTITPSANLASELTVNVDIVAGQIVDKATAPNPLAAGLAGKFKVIDYVNPNWDAVPVATAGNNKFDISTVSINEAGKIYVYAVKTGTLATTPSPASVKQNATKTQSVVAADNSLSVTGLDGKTAYDLYFVAEDLVPNLMDGTSVNETVLKISNVTTLDNIAPMILTSFNTLGFTAGLSPKNGETCVATATTLQIKFDETIGTVDATKFWVRKLSDNTSVGITSVLAAADVVTITLTAPLAEKEEYFVEINPGAVKDAALVPNTWPTVFYGSSSWKFTTRDEQAPLILGATDLYPKNGELVALVATSNSLIMKFNEPVSKNTSANVFIDIYRDGTATPHERMNVLNGNVKVAADGKTVTIERQNVYASESTYYVLIPNNAFFDSSCRPNFFAGYAASTDWKFTTEDKTAPVLSWSPNGSSVVNALSQGSTILMNVNEDLYNGATALNGSDLKAQFSVVNTNGSVAITSAVYNSVTDQVTVTLTNPISSNQTYTASYASTSTISDDAGNAVPSSSVTFNTDDRLSPVVTITATSTNPTTPLQVKLGTKFKIEFNKPIVNSGGGTDNIAPTKAELEVANAFFTITPAIAYTINEVTSGKVYEVVPNVALSSNTTYTIAWTATTGAGGGAERIKDVVFIPIGNEMSKAVADMTFAFNSEDGVNPSMDNLVPSTTTPLTIINSNSKLTISFNEKVKGNNAAGKIIIRYSNGQIFDQVNPEDCNFTDAVTFDVVITPTKALGFDAHRDYYVEIPAGAFTDVSYNNNPYAGFMGNTVWKFKTDDGLAPTVSLYSPVDNDNGIAINSNLVLTFSENVKKSLTSKKLAIYFNDGATIDGNAKEIIDVLDGTRVVVSGSNPADPNKTSNVVTINPDMSFDYTGPGEYYVRIEEGFVTDFAGALNKYAGISDNTTWSFKIADPSAPNLVLGSNPRHGDIGVANTLTGVSMEFDRDITTGIGEIKLYQYNYTTTPFSETTKLVSWANVASDVSINHTSKTVTFDFNEIDPLTQNPIPNSPLVLDDNSVYYILADNGSFKNTTLPAVQATWWIGISDPFKWRFTTNDNTAPTVVAVKSNEIGLDDNMSQFDVTLTFSEPVIGVDETTITVSEGSTMTVPVAVSGFLYTTTITASDLADVVLTLSNSIKDPSDNLLVADPITFSVADNNAPTLVATLAEPLVDGKVATNVFTVNLTFSEPVVGVDESSVTVDNGATVVITGSGAVYQAVITAQSSSVVGLSFANTIVDMATPVAHPFVGLPIYYTVTGDAVAPTIVELSPADGTGITPETGVIAKPEFKIVFSEPVVKGAGTLRIYKQEVSSVNTLVLPALSIADAIISEDGLTLTIPSITALEDNKDYLVLVDAGIVESMYGVAFAGINDPTTWNFKTGDNKAPELTIIPGVLVNTKNDILATLVFTEPVYGLADAVVVTGNTVAPVITGVDGDNVYTVAIKAADLANVSLTVNTTVADKYLRNNLVEAQTINYTVGDNTKPFVVGEPTSVVNGNLITTTVTFSEVVTVPVGAITASNITDGSLEVATVDGIVYTVTMNAADGSAVSIAVANTVVDGNANTFNGGTYGPYNVGDNTAPTVNASPVSGTIDLPSNFQVALTFNEAVIVPQGAISVTGATADISNVGNVYTVSVRGVADNSMVSIDLSSAITDVAENVFVAQTLTYTTGDNTTPTLVVTDPLIPITKNFTVGLTFSEAVVMPATLAITNGTLVGITGSGANYQLEITAGEKAVVGISIPNTITDISGNNNFAGKELSYTVGDFSGPVVTANPSNGVGLPQKFSVVLTFSEDAIVTNSDITVSVNGVISTSQTVTNTGNVYTVAVTAPDNANVTITAASTIKDASNNVIVGIRSFTYTTGDTTAPLIITTNPNGGATENAHPVNFEIFVNELVVKGAGKLTVYKKAGDVKTMELDIASATIVPWLSSYKVTIPLSGSLDRFTDYYVLVSEGFVADPSGNKLAAVTSKTFWTFKTGDWVVGIIDPIQNGSLFKVYPNPFVDFVNVANASQLSKVVVSNIAGQVVKEVVNPNDRIQLNELRSGVYFISLYNMDNVIAKTAKIVKR